MTKTLGADATLDLRAHNNININASITSTTGQLNMIFDANQDNVGGGIINLTNFATLDANGGTIDASNETITIGNATINSALTAATVNKSGSGLTIGGTLSVTSAFNWSGSNSGSINGGPGSGVLDIQPGANFNITIFRMFINNAPSVLNNLVINNAGSINFNPGESNDPLSLTGGTVINNSGTFDIQRMNAKITGDFSGVINNTNLFQQSGGGISEVERVTFNSTTATISETGDLRFTHVGTLDGNHTLVGSPSFGSFGSIFNITDGSIFTGTLTTGSGTVNLQGDFQIDTLNLSGSGVLNIDSLGLGSTGDTLTVTSALNWFGINGAAPISGGGTGILDIQSGANFNISVFRTFGSQNSPLDSLVVNNAGSINYNPGLSDDPLSLTGGTVINNSGTFDIQLANVGIAGAGAINNSGVFNKSSTGLSTISNTLAFSNTGGTVDLQTGTLTLGGNTLNLDATSLLTGGGMGLGASPATLITVARFNLQGRYS